jgi:molybdenum cofactor guanylyltransferase
VIAAVIAGGAGRRLGASKPTAPLGGRPLISYPLAAAREAGLRTIVVAKQHTPLPALEEPVVREPDEPLHPLCGALAALRHARQTIGCAAVLLLACDMPFLTGELLAWLAALDGAAMARCGGRPQPLLGRYPVQRIGAVASGMATGRSLASTLAAGETRIVEEAELARFGEPARLVFNVNDARDLAVAEEMLAQAPQASWLAS